MVRNIQNMQCIHYDAIWCNMGSCILRWESTFVFINVKWCIVAWYIFWKSRFYFTIGPSCIIQCTELKVYFWLGWWANTVPTDGNLMYLIKIGVLWILYKLVSFLEYVSILPSISKCCGVDSRAYTRLKTRHHFREEYLRRRYPC